VLIQTNTASRPKSSAGLSWPPPGRPAHARSRQGAARRPVAPGSPAGSGHSRSITAPGRPGPSAGRRVHPAWLGPGSIVEGSWPRSPAPPARARPGASRRPGCAWLAGGLGSRRRSIAAPPGRSAPTPRCRPGVSWPAGSAWLAGGPTPKLPTATLTLRDRNDQGDGGRSTQETPRARRDIV
jgi:hypothetical protein